MDEEDRHIRQGHSGGANQCLQALVHCLCASTSQSAHKSQQMRDSILRQHDGAEGVHRRSHTKVPAVRAGVKEGHQNVAQLLQSTLLSTHGKIKVT